MIDGINIFAQRTVLVEIGTTWGFSISAVVGSIFIVLGLIVLYQLVKEHGCPTWAPIVLIILFSVGIFGWHCKPVEQECIEYKALIDDSVTLHDFDDKYVMIDYDGEIYIFRERAITEIR